MGDADVGASSLESGDAGGLAASRALMEGGSLPPRKRLLAGLKQNGWLSTSPPPAESPTAGGYVSAPASVGAVAGKYEEGSCMGCSAVETTALRRIKRGGVVLRLCSACTLLYSKSMFCPHCLVMYHDATLLGDPSMWLVCTRCRRSVHPECEQKHSGSKPEAASYVCLDCVNSARRQREANGVTGMRSKHSSGRPVPNFHGETASPVDFVSPALKKPRLHRERSSRPGDHGDGSRFERHRPSPDAAGGTKGSTLGVPPRKVVSSQTPPAGTAGATAAAAVSPQEAAVAARNAAIAAAKVAAAKKATAAAKASAAVKLAAAAKAALEAAAHAKKAEAACQAELRRKMGTSQTRLAGATRLEINVHPEPRRERSFKHEGGDGRRTGAGSVDDEELARQLHRVMNSSPRISRSMTPMRRKASVKPETPSSGVSNSSAETVRARPRPSPVEPEAHVQHEHEHHQFRQRPRSVTHKEFRRIESRVSRHEVKPIADEGTTALEPPSQEAVLSHMPAEDLAVKSEAMDGVMFAPAGVQDEASILFDALVEADGEGMHAAAGGPEGSHDRRPDYLQEILEAAVLSDAAMFNDAPHHDTERPEPVPLETPSLPSEPEPAAEPPKDETAATSVTVDAMAVDSMAVEAIAMSSGPDEETVVHDVEMQEVGRADAAPASKALTPEPSSTKETEAETRIESTPSTVEATLPSQNTNSDPPEIETQAASPATAPQQSG